MWVACALGVGVIGCGGSEVPTAVQREVVVGEQVHVYIAHGRDIQETLRALQKEIDEERSKSGGPAVVVRDDLATTMNVEDARRRIANGSLHMRWAIPEEARIESGFVMCVPLTPRK
jgi:hypothetical protein